MKNILTLRFAIAASLAGISLHAVPITPTGTFGPTSDNFGGNGIPNDAVANSIILDGDTTLSLSLTAHQRYDNPPLSNDGAGTFTATAGANEKNGIMGSFWNFAWDITLAGTGLPSDYEFTMLYDFDPAAGTDETTHGAIHLNVLNWMEDSQNLYFDFLDGGTPNGAFAFSVGLTTPPIGSFDPYINGEYSFALVAEKNGQEIGRSAIVVNVVGGTDVPDAGSTFGLCLIGFAGLAGIRKLRR